MNTSEEPLYNLTEHPQHAIILGQISAMWAALEYRLCHLFTWMIGCHPRQGSAAFFMLQNNKARQDMIRGLMKYLHNSEEEQAVEGIMKKFSKMAKIRNRYCHSHWYRKGDNIYTMSSLEINFPHGYLQLVKIEDMWKDGIAFVEFLKEFDETIATLTQQRPLRIDDEAMPPALRGKNRLPPIYQWFGENPQSPTTPEEPDPQPSTSDE